MKTTRKPADRREAAFTMVEIAISIAVVAFALVAIIGVLPTGFQIQRENREDTIINQEGMLWLEAIRSGARGMDYLTNHVVFIRQIQRWGGQTRTNTYRYRAGYASGIEIVGLLTQPKYVQDGQGNWMTSRAQALVRAISGSAIGKSLTNEFAFTYLLEVEAVPYNPFAPAETNWQSGGLDQVEWVVRSNNWVVARNLERNAWALRLTLSWPAEELGRDRLRVGRGRRVFRVLNSGWMQRDELPDAPPLHLMQPSEFRRAK
jgi:hypothetical protein